MEMKWILTGLLFVLFTTAAMGQDLDSQSLWPIEEQMLKDVNAVRSQHGRPPLQPDMHLFRSARRHCNWMTQNGMIHSNGPVAENIAAGQTSSSNVHNDWRNSPGHFANMLDNHTHIGCTCINRNGTPYWIQQFRRY